VPILKANDETFNFQDAPSEVASELHWQCNAKNLISVCAELQEAKQNQSNLLPADTIEMLL
jgi:hypothetical protein